MENYYGLLREKFPSDDSSVTISNLHSIRCIYQVSDLFHALPSKEQLFTNDLFGELLQHPDVTRIQASSLTSKIMLFPFLYVPDNQFLLGIVLPDNAHIHFLDTQFDDERQSFFSSLFPLFLSSYIKGTKTEQIEFHVTGEGNGETNDSAKFVCVYMYIIMELN